MNIQINAENIQSKNDPSYMVQVIVNGKFVTINQHTTTLSKLVNFYQKWAYRTYKVENAVVTVTEKTWIPD